MHQPFFKTRKLEVFLSDIFFVIMYFRTCRIYFHVQNGSNSVLARTFGDCAWAAECQVDIHIAMTEAERRPNILSGTVI